LSVPLGFLGYQTSSPDDHEHQHQEERKRETFSVLASYFDCRMPIKPMLAARTFRQTQVSAAKQKR
jgi:hypothetical protein